MPQARVADDAPGDVVGASGSPDVARHRGGDLGVPDVEGDGRRAHAGGEHRNEESRGREHDVVD